MSMNWYVNAGDTIHGPFDGSKLRALATAGKITRSTPVGNSPTGPWKRAAAIRGLFPETTAAGAAPISYSTHRPPSSPPPLPGAAPAFRLPAPSPVHAPGQDHAEPDIDREKQSADTDKKSSMAKVWGGIGGLAGAAVVVFNIGVVIYNGYLRTDAAAINLIKNSMQTTLAHDPELDKPVKVLKVELKGDGQHRTGTVTMKCGNTPHAVPFTAEITHVGRDLRTSWAINGEDKPVSPAKRSHTSTPIPTKTAPSNTPPPRTARSRQQPARPSPSAPSQRNPSVSGFKAAQAEADSGERFLEALSEWQSAIAEVSSLELQLSNEGSTWEEDVLVMRKLLVAWNDVRTSSKSLRQIARSIPNEQVKDAGKAELFLQILVLTETTAPGLMKQLNAAVSSSGEAARQAAVETYWELSESIGNAMEQLQASD